MDDIDKKRKDLIEKYNPAEQKFDLIKKYALFWRPLDADLGLWKLVSKCDTEEEAYNELKWRARYHKTNDKEVVLDHDKRFETFRDETKNVDKDGNPKGYKKDGSMEIRQINPQKDFNNSFKEVASRDDGFRDLAYYASIPIEYRGEYIIMPIYEIE